MVEQSPTSRQLVVNYPELDVDQSPISHRPIDDLSPTDCRLIAKRSPNVQQLIGDSSATGPRPYQQWKNSCNGRRSCKQKSVAVRSRQGRKLCGTGALDNSTKTFAALSKLYYEFWYLQMYFQHNDNTMERQDTKYHRCHRVVCSLWLWYFLIILAYYFWNLNTTYQ